MRTRRSGFCESAVALVGTRLRDSAGGDQDVSLSAGRRALAERRTADQQFAVFTILMIHDDMKLRAQYFLAAMSCRVV
jgi:hypothetical protein